LNKNHKTIFKGHRYSTCI